eukprot:TRINITY_DN4136_c0_g1_i4.p1 TRINITY_DN4136_c0_g1~~TRINITY_DN4136_c0_g1_i4.p1  ORF type:complete len:1981 (+),score=664.62 TRINITY_DN4136_c0_g1_i4:267-6209(+)
MESMVRKIKTGQAFLEVDLKALQNVVSNKIKASKPENPSPTDPEKPTGKKPPKEQQMPKELDFALWEKDGKNILEIAVEALAPKGDYDKMSAENTRALLSILEQILSPDRAETLHFDRNRFFQRYQRCHAVSKHIILGGKICPFYILIDLGLVDFFKNLGDILEGTSFDVDSFRDTQHTSLLTYAAVKAKTGIVRELLKAGGSPLIPNKLGEVAITVIAARAYPPEFDDGDPKTTDDEEESVLKQKEDMLKKRTILKDNMTLFDEMLLRVHPFSVIPAHDVTPRLSSSTSTPFGERDDGTAYHDENTYAYTFAKTFAIVPEKSSKNPDAPLTAGIEMRHMEKEALLLALVKKSPKAVEVLLQRFESDKGYDGVQTFTTYNYAQNDANGPDRKKWYDFMLTKECRDSVIQVLDSQNTVILRNQGIQSMLNAFWDHSVRKYVWFEFISFVFFLIWSCLLINLGVLNRTEPPPDEPKWTLEPTQAWIITTDVNAALVLFFGFICMFVEGMHIIFLQGKYFTDPWNYPDWAAYIIITYSSIRLLIGNHVWNDIEKQFYGGAILYLWFKLMEYGGAFGRTSGVSKLFLGMLKTLAQYLMILLLFVFAFGHSMFLAMAVPGPDGTPSIPDFQNVGLSILRVYRALMGETLDFGSLMSSSPLAVILYFLFTISGALLLLNLLIALMTQMFETVQSNIEDNFLKDRAVFVSKKLRVYILSQWNFTLFAPLKPRLHPLQVYLDEKRKQFNRRVDDQELSRFEKFKRIFFSPPKSAIEAKNSVKWALFIRSTLFRPYIAGMEPTSNEYENIIVEEEWRDWNGRVVHKKDMTFANVTEQQWTQTQGKVTQMGIRVHDQIADIEKKQQDIQVLLKNVADHSFLATSVGTMNHEKAVVRQQAVGMLRQSLILQVESGNPKIVDLVICATLADPDYQVVSTALNVIEEKKICSDDIAQSMVTLVSSYDITLVIKTIQTISALIPSMDNDKRGLFVQELTKILENNSNESIQIECALTLAILARASGITLGDDIIAKIQLPLSRLIEDPSQTNERVSQVLSVIGESSLGGSAIVGSMSKTMSRLLEEKDFPMLKELIHTMSPLVPIRSGEVGMTIETCLEENKCTFLVSGDNTFPEQDYASCDNCRMPSASICKPCLDVCHKLDPVTHPVAHNSTIHGNCYCDCGARGPSFCKLLAKTDPRILQEHSNVVQNMLDILNYRKTLSKDDFSADSEDFFEIEILAVYTLTRVKDDAATAKTAKTFLKCMSRTHLEEFIPEVIAEMLPINKKFSDVIIKKYQSLLKDENEDKDQLLATLFNMLAVSRTLPVDQLIKTARNFLKNSHSDELIMTAITVLKMFETEISKNKELYTELLGLTKSKFSPEIVQSLIGEEFAKPGLLGEYFIPSLLKESANFDIILSAARALIPTAPWLECRKQKICTRLFTGKEYTPQHWKRCQGQSLGSGVCITCLDICHQEGGYLDADYRFSNFFCDCPELDNCKQNKEKDENAVSLRNKILRESLDPIFEILTRRLTEQLDISGVANVELVEKMNDLINLLPQQWKYQNQSFQNVLARIIRKMPMDEIEARYQFLLTYALFTKEILPEMDVMMDLFEVAEEDTTAYAIRELASDIIVVLTKAGNPRVVNRLLSVFQFNYASDILYNENELWMALMEYVTQKIESAPNKADPEIQKLGSALNSILYGNSVLVENLNALSMVAPLTSLNGPKALKNFTKVFIMREVIEKGGKGDCIQAWPDSLLENIPEQAKFVPDPKYDSDDDQEVISGLYTKYRAEVTEAAEKHIVEAIVELQKSSRDDWPSYEVFDQWIKYLATGEVAKETTPEGKAKAIYKKEVLGNRRQVYDDDDLDVTHGDVSSESSAESQKEEGNKLVHFEDEKVEETEESTSESESASKTSENRSRSESKTSENRSRSESKASENRSRSASKASVPEATEQAPLVPLDSPKPDRKPDEGDTETDEGETSSQETDSEASEAALVQ